MDDRAPTADRLAESALSADENKRHRDLIPEYQREEMAERLEREGAGDLALHLRNCGTGLALVCCGCGSKHRTEIRCRKRWCPVCAPLIGRERLRRWKGAVEAMQWPLMMTLTVKNSPDVECIRELRASWAKFRRRKLLREKIAGGVAAVEVTNIGNGWHPHLHAIVDCQWLSLYTREPKSRDSAETVKELCTSAAQELGELWSQQIKQKSASVKVGRVSGEQATVYSLKYATKAVELLALEGELAPLIRTLRKTRLVSGFGSLHPLPSVDVESKPGLCCADCGMESAWMPETILTAVINKNRSYAETIGRTLPPSKQDNPKAP